VNVEEEAVFSLYSLREEVVHLLEDTPYPLGFGGGTDWWHGASGRDN